MTQEIKNYNRLCAVFLGWKYNKNSDDYQPTDFRFGSAKWLSDMQFHSDWNWIHEIIQKIKNTTNPKEHSDTTFSTLRKKIQTHLGRSDKEAVVQAINQFLIWYNEQNN